ncbi:MAG: D-alanine--D-alanine ligase [Candidatus Saganbacteria bacterium]|nr:D-alanine--D-alanine ligase [Candidatus Saganbacteria bacterium]
MFKDKKIAVLLGGKSGERDISIRSGNNVLSSLKRQGLDVISIDPAEADLISEIKKNKIDLVYIALHGKFGEDGVVQGLLEHYGIPYTGSKILASALAMNKVATKQILMTEKIPTPKYTRINTEKINTEVTRIVKDFPFPLMLKPEEEGSSLGISLIKDPGKFGDVLRETAQKFPQLFVEQYIKGTEITIGVLGTKKVEALPVLELVPKNEFYDFEAKYTKGMTEFILPARLSKDVCKKAQEIAVASHQVLGCYGVSRVDLMVSNDGTPYVNEINTIPGMTDTSDLPAQAKHIGISFDELVLKILESAY